MSLIQDKELLSIFKEEVREYLTEIENIILQRQEPSPFSEDTKNKLLRIFHSIKGASATVGHISISKLAHLVESFLNKVFASGKNKLEFSNDEIKNFLSGIINIIEILLEHPEKKIDNVIEILENFEPDKKNQLFDIILKYTGQISSGITEMIKVNASQINEIDSLFHEILLKHSSYTNLLDKLNSLKDEIENSLSLHKLESIKEEVEEFKSQLLYFNFVNKHIHSSLEVFHEYFHSLTLISPDIISGKLYRTVNEVCRQTGKEAELIIEGEDLKMDRIIIERLVDPLIHLLRNAVDHGIEFPEERIKKGKPPAGKITISFIRENKFIKISVKDDGRGIDIESIKKKLLNKEVYTEEQVKSLSDEMLLSFIFQPGFSTREEITEISGRGVGMDIVYNNITSLNGKIFIHTEKDKGTEFEMLIPFNISLISLFLFKINSLILAFPSHLVVKVIKKDNVKIEKIENRKFLFIEERKGIKRVEVISFKEFFFLENILESHFIIMDINSQLFAFGVSNTIGIINTIINKIKNPFLKIRYSDSIFLYENRIPVFIIDPYKLIYDHFIMQSRR